MDLSQFISLYKTRATTPFLIESKFVHQHLQSFQEQNRTGQRQGRGFIHSYIPGKWDTQI